MSYHSQFGEDRILERIFGNKTGGVCVEVGGNDGTSGSNTLHFEQLGWKSVLIEPLPHLCEIIKTTRSASTIVIQAAASDRAATAARFFVAGAVEGMSTLVHDATHFARIEGAGGSIRETTVPSDTLDNLLQPHLSGVIDFITIDVEGAEMQVLAGLSLERWSPRVLVVEDNSNGQDRRVRDYLARRGYVNFRRTGVNDWYARASDRILTGRLAMARFACTRAGNSLACTARPVLQAMLPVPLWQMARRMKRALAGR